MEFASPKGVSSKRLLALGAFPNNDSRAVDRKKKFDISRGETDVVKTQ
jgi:hypothetical protein